MNELRVIEHKKQRVLTTAQLAEAYHTEEVNIRMNFTRNKDRFIEGLHFYLLKGDELAAFKDSVTNSYLVDKRTPSLILWTHKGASRHCKMLDTDEAWAQFDALEETYFKAKELFALPQSLPEALRYAAELAEQVEQQKPLVAFAEIAAKSEDSLLIRELAKVCCKRGIETGEKRLYNRLRGWGLIMRDSCEPYQEYVDRGYFEVVESVKNRGESSRIFKTTRVLPKGQVYIMDRLKKEAV